jgi:hypothetical protein
MLRRACRHGVVDMTPVMCRNRHNPPTSYGDCLRACIATIMDLDAEHVPHFADMAARGDEARASARRWLGLRGFTVTGFAMPADPLESVMEWMGENNPDTTWMLFGSTARAGQPVGGDHVVVCQGGAVVHDPAWVPSSIKQVGSCGYWEIWVVSKL